MGTTQVSLRGGYHHTASSESSTCYYTKDMRDIISFACGVTAFATFGVIGLLCIKRDIENPWYLTLSAIPIAIGALVQCSHPIIADCMSDYRAGIRFDRAQRHHNEFPVQASGIPYGNARDPGGPPSMDPDVAKAEDDGIFAGVFGSLPPQSRDPGGSVSN